MANTTDAERDQAAREVAKAVAAYFGAGPADQVYVFAGAHEGLSDAARVVTWEGGPFEWPITWPDTDQGRRTADRLGVWFEPVHGCALAIFPR